MSYCFFRFRQKTRYLEYLLIPLLAFALAILTFFSGFGLGTLLAPGLMLFFPVEQAIALTAVVHLLNNLYKFSLLRLEIDRGVFLGFGLPAIAASFAGAWALIRLSDLTQPIPYALAGIELETQPLKIGMGLLLLIFALMELLPALQNLRFGKGWLSLGGLLSGFFGGLSGHQGALRAAFLSKAGLSKEGFVATGVAVSLLIDLSRLSLYAGRMKDLQEAWLLMLLCTVAALAGSLMGFSLLKKTSLPLVKSLLGSLLLLMAIALGMGLI